MIEIVADSLDDDLVAVALNSGGEKIALYTDALNGPALRPHQAWIDYCGFGMKSGHADRFAARSSYGKAL